MKGRNDSKGAVEKAFACRRAIVDDIEAPGTKLFRVLTANLVKGQALPAPKRDLPQVAPGNA